MYNKILAKKNQKPHIVQNPRKLNSYKNLKQGSKT